MPALLIRQKVEDYASWRTTIDDHALNRRANGSLGGRVLVSADDPSEMHVLLNWDDLDRARLFSQSDDFREAMARAGGGAETEMWLLNEIGHLPE